MAGFPATELQRIQGERLRVLREAHDLSQTAMADILGVAANTLSSYEVGRTRIDILALARLCEHLQLSADWIVAGNIARLPADIAARIQTLQRTAAGATPVKRAGRPRRPAAPLVENLPSWPPPPTSGALHAESARFIPPPKKHTM